jgi:hypothetical protein
MAPATWGGALKQSDKGFTPTVKYMVGFLDKVLKQAH